jgi:imidazolonepropionase-like amidohydrolase
MIRRPLIMLAALIVGLPSPVFSQQQATDNSQRPLPTAVRAARLLDVKNGTLINNAVVLIEGERISAVGSGLPIPAGAKVIDLGDVTLLPGLIDCHTHLLASDTDDYGKMLLTKPQAYRALEGASNARRTLLAGFTSVRDVASEGAGYADVALRDAVNRGLVEGPRMKVATRAIAAVGGYLPSGVSPDLPDFPRGAQMISGVEEARRAVREQISNGADLIKVFADWNYPTLTPEELRVIVEEAHKAGKTVAAHGQSTNEGIRNAVNAGVDSIEHGDRADRAMLELMKQKGVWLVPTFGRQLQRLAEFKDDEARFKRVSARLQEKQKMLQTARELGVKIALGYDPAEAEMHGANAREIFALTTAGFTNLEAIRAATTSGAELLGWPDRVGSLEAGKFADIIAVPGNPLTDIKQLEHVSFVMKGGVVIRGESKVPR